MKYIRGQNGCIYSVSRLMPPCEGHPEGGTVWRMSVITVDGNECAYATYTTESAAIITYSQMTEFMAGNGTMIEFTLGLNGICHKTERPLRVMIDADSLAFGGLLDKAPTLLLDGGTAGCPTDVVPTKTDAAEEKLDG